MSGWSLTWKGRSPPDGWVDGSAVRPDLLGKAAIADVRAARIRVGAGERRLDDLYDVVPLENTGEDAFLRVDGSARYLGLGRGMERGVLEVIGDGGEQVGAGLRGGEIRVTGSAGEGAGAEMESGLLRIAGSAGAGLGGPGPGKTRGMRGGEIFVGGSAGTEAGLALRRGLIAIAGDAGPLAGHWMRAGTILVGSGKLSQPGLGLRRGTIIALGGAAVPPGYARNGPVHPVWLRLVARRLRGAHFDAMAQRLAQGNAFESWSGDLLSLGRGEILIPA